MEPSLLDYLPLLLRKEDLMARLSMAQRRALPPGAFVFQGRAPGPGSYPIPDRAHAVAALRLVAMHGSPAEQARVRAAVRRRFGIG